MEIVYAGTPEFSAWILQRLLQDRRNVTAVLTRPDRRRGRGMKVEFSPVKKVALEYDIEVLQPVSVKTPEFLTWFRQASPDVFITAAVGQILPTEILNIPARGAVNVHTSLLPKYRGPAPINHAIWNGESETGVSIIEMTPEIDAGDILLQQAIPIASEDNAVTMTEKLAELGGELIVETLRLMEKDLLKPKPQEHHRATYAPMLKKSDGVVDWEKSARQIWNQMRALVPWPRTFSVIHGSRLTLHQAHPQDSFPDQAPGVIVDVGEEAVSVACGEGVLHLTELQREGKKRMNAGDFLKGFPLAVGDRFESNSTLP